MFNFLKKYTNTLLKRLILVILIPMFLLQIISIYVFFQRYWEKVYKKNLNNIFNEINNLNIQFEKEISKQKEISNILDNLNNFTRTCKINFSNNKINDRAIIFYKKYNPIFFMNPIQYLTNLLKNHFQNNLALYKNNINNYILEIEKKNGILIFEIEKRQIYISNINLILFWNCLSFFLLAIIAILFVKKQVKSINELKNFANDFSYLEKENKNFKPSGALEIKEMGNAFINIINKIKELMNSRTVMLAQISHDLRTPLTRMKLQLEFIEDKEITSFFKQDLDEMEKMINEYILFAKGETENELKDINIKIFFNSIINDYKRSGYKDIKIFYLLKNDFVKIKPNYFKRAINNLINNSLKFYKKKININIIRTATNFIFIIEDDGDSLKNNFEKKKNIKNIKDFKTMQINSNKGSGLGLLIVEQIVLAHRGKLKFRQSELGGLNVSINIPLNNKKVK